MKSANSLSRLLTLGLMAFSAVALAPNACAELLAYEKFDYTSGAITGKGGATDGFAGAWYNPTGISGNVTTGISRLPLVASGAAADMSGASTTINFRVLEAPINNTATETWISLLGQRTTTATASLFSGISFYSGGEGDAETEWAIASGASSGQPVWRLTDLRNLLSGIDASTGVVIENGRVDLLLAQVVWSELGNEQVNLWVNPPTTELALPAPTTLSMDIPFFDRIRLASSGGAPFIYDEIRIGESFEDVYQMVPPDPDLDNNGNVGTSDFDLIRNNFLTANTNAMGDVNFDGFVDHTDYFLWRQAFLLEGGSLSQISWTSIPEPSSILLVGVALFGGVAMARKRRHRG